MNAVDPIVEGTACKYTDGEQHKNTASMSRCPWNVCCGTQSCLLLIRSHWHCTSEMGETLRY